tara:strand:- start:4849 stop:4953 length:105 start_codon:yes stop_codon:yes gene_type:complete
MMMKVILKADHQDYLAYHRDEKFGQLQKIIAVDS